MIPVNDHDENYFRNRKLLWTAYTHPAIVSIQCEMKVIRWTRILSNKENLYYG